MSIFNLFSKRQKKLRGEMPDVYSFTDVPDHLRVQIVHIIRDALGESRDANEAYQNINDALCREYGLFKLTEYPNSIEESVLNFFLSTKKYEEALDVIELCFKIIDTSVRSTTYQYSSNPKVHPDSAITELNYRFKEHCVGFQFESGELIRVDSQFIHSEIVKPVLSVLKEKMYKGANEEFLKAHEHYRHQRNKECLNESLKSFESVMKAICTKHKWTFKTNDTAKALISICFKKNLVPSYLQSQFTSLRAVFESGVPTVRNKLGGHGQGSQTITVSDEMTRYVLNLTASNILFLAEHEKHI